MRSPGPVQRQRVNHMIRISPIRLVGPDNEQIGVVDTPDALRRAQEMGLDLVEVVPDSRPPVCKIMDYGKHKYDLSKKQTNKAGKQQELKEIRLGRSIKIDPHDVKIRVDQARRFLMAGHKVQFTQRFRGREMMHKELGLERLREICDDLSDIAKIEMAPRWMGRQTSIVLAPQRDKIESLKAKMTREQREAEERELEEAEKRRLEALEADEAEGDDDDAEGDEAESSDDSGSKDKSGKGTKKGKGPADDRASNPIDDEIAELLG